MKDKKNSLWLGLQYALSILFAFTIIKINILHFGEALFGMWLIFLSIWNTGIALDFGFGTTLIKFIAEADNKNDTHEIALLISNGLFFFSILGLVIFFICVLVINILLINNTNIVPSEYHSIAIKIYPLLGINFYLQYLAYSFRSIFEGVRNFVLSSKILLTYNILNLLVVLLIKLLDLSMVNMAVGLIINSLIYLIISFMLFQKYYNYINIGFSLFQKKIIKRILKFSFHIQLASIFNSLIEPIVKYIIGNSYSLSLVTVYDIGRKVTISVSGLFFATFKTLLPKASILKNTDESFLFFNTQVAEISKYGIIYSGLVFGIASFFLAGVIKIFFITDTILLVILILALGETINNFGYAIYIFLLGIGKASFLSFIQFINLILVVLGLFLGFLIFNNPIGLLGYFTSVLIGNILMLLVIRKIFSDNLKLFLTNVKIHKLIAFIFLLLLSTIMLNIKKEYLYEIFTFLSVSSVLLFYNDIKSLYKKVLLIVKNLSD